MKKKSIGSVLVLELIVIVVVVAMAVAMDAGTNFKIGNLIDVPSVLLIALFSLPAMFATGRFKDFTRCFSIGKKEYALIDLRRSLDAVRLMIKYVLCGALLSVTVAGIVIGINIKDMAVIPINVAVAIIVVFYSVILEVFLITIEAHVQNAILDAMDTRDEETE